MLPAWTSSANPFGKTRDNISHHWSVEIKYRTGFFFIFLLRQKTNIRKICNYPIHPSFICYSKIHNFFQPNEHVCCSKLNISETFDFILFLNKNFWSFDVALKLRYEILTQNAVRMLAKGKNLKNFALLTKFCIRKQNYTKQVGCTSSVVSFKGGADSNHSWVVTYCTENLAPDWFKLMFTQCSHHAFGGRYFRLRNLQGPIRSGNLQLPCIFLLSACAAQNVSTLIWFTSNVWSISKTSRRAPNFSQKNQKFSKEQGLFLQKFWFFQAAPTILVLSMWCIWFLSEKICLASLNNSP